MTPHLEQVFSAHIVHDTDPILAEVLQRVDEPLVLLRRPRAVLHLLLLISLPYLRLRRALYALLAALATRTVALFFVFVFDLLCTRRVVSYKIDRAVARLNLNDFISA